MVSRKLYIIGNGFDLWHGVKSAFSNFRDYVYQRNDLVYRDVEEYLGAGDEWGDLEVALGELDIEHLLSNNECHLLSPSDPEWRDSANHDFQFEIERCVNHLSLELRTLFIEWLKQLNPPAPIYLLKSLDTSSQYLTFNYTKTLNTLYGVPDSSVLHIHGEISRPESVVLGHSWTPERSLNDRFDIADIDTRLMEANSIIDSYFTKTFKPSMELLNANAAFFKDLVGVTDVYILGHSMSPVDKLYYEAIISTLNTEHCHWHIACRNKDDDASAKLERLSELGVSKERVSLYLWHEM
ncbi:Uncharacterised protein [Serratia marcescens]|uniref:bacteriophage abortive infection AbiH family protein n=1 Tax=Serratia TaxID=613 RepID=UPI00074561CC|nr:bacteriophage abortive infection AbiH family protein [Serratia marcescens]CUY43248.1 Uncharacterised protein [Serratia marcescens]CUY98463.1 Uncharacterised protein [Serratia marcescens]CUZ28194.1 Uncharacterised protein [Serratia marcescens]CVB62379.1 Uncharacterised protein [Serratia marcescens]CVD00629.1 Uncharacterised protein [Serratia marcescens]